MRDARPIAINTAATAGIVRPMVADSPSVAEPGQLNLVPFLARG